MKIYANVLQPVGLSKSHCAFRLLRKLDRVKKRVKNGWSRSSEAGWGGGGVTFVPSPDTLKLLS